MSATTNRESGLLHQGLPATTHEAARKFLLLCGVLYGVLYVIANDLVAAWLYGGYSRMSQAISELSATGSPARAFLAALLPLFGALLIAFGVGVWWSARGRRSLQITGGLLVAQGITSLLWLFGPMSSREEIAAHGGSASDLLHLVLSGLSALFIVAEMAFGAAARGRAFRVFSIITILVILGFGAGTAVLSQNLATGEPTRWLGVVERIMLGAWLLWMTVLAVELFRGKREPAPL